MRILVVGAGAIGGYFGGRLLDAGRDVTFLVRPRRAALLAAHGLVIKSRKGDLHIEASPTVTAGELKSHFDLVFLSCKAFDLPDAIESFAPAVGPETMILPMLNGLAHLDALAARFGGAHVLGGQCKISTTFDSDGRILHLSPFQSLSFGELDGTRTARIEAVAAALTGAGFDARFSDAILSEMWAKWVFIAAAAGIGCLMRGTVGDIVAVGGAAYSKEIIDECAAIAARQGFALSRSDLQPGVTMLTEPGSAFKPSMLRDVERDLPIESDHIVSDLLRRGGDLPSPLLRIADAHLKTYQARRAREAAAKNV